MGCCALQATAPSAQARNTATDTTAGKPSEKPRHDRPSILKPAKDVGSFNSTSLKGLVYESKNEPAACASTDTTMSALHPLPGAISTFQRNFDKETEEREKGSPNPKKKDLNDVPTKPAFPLEASQCDAQQTTDDTCMSPLVPPRNESGGIEPGACATKAAPVVTDPKPNNTEEFKKVVFKRALGSGSYGIVYLAETPSKSEVAVKVLTFDLKDPHLKKKLQLLERELSVAEQLEPHPNVVRYFSSKRRNNQIFVFMQFCSGGSLRQLYLKEGGPLKPAFGAKACRDILLGLQYLHNQRVVHRDIKCDNVLLDETGTCRLADFGAATVLLPEVSQKSFIGTIYWMAPEVLTNSGHSWQADIWSVGCTLMEMLTATYPFADRFTDTNLFIQCAMRQREFPVPESIKFPECVQFIKACLVTDPKNRPSASTMLEHHFITSAAP